MYSPKPGTTTCGPAITVKMVENKSPGPSPPIHFADANKKGHVMYIQQPKELPSACWGGLMSTRAQQLGGLGVIIDGRMRDTQEHRDISFPVCQTQYSFRKFELYQLTNTYRSLRGEPPF